MKLLSNVLIAAFLACVLASVAPVLSDELEPTLSTMVVTDSAGAETPLDVYPGLIGVNDILAPVYIVADKAGDIEMLCFTPTRENAGIRKGESRTPGYSQPDVLTAALAMARWREQHRGGG